MLSDPSLPSMNPFCDGWMMSWAAGVIADAIVRARILFSQLLTTMGRVDSGLKESSLGIKKPRPRLKPLGGDTPEALSMMTSSIKVEVKCV